MLNAPTHRTRVREVEALQMSAATFDEILTWPTVKRADASLTVFVVPEPHYVKGVVREGDWLIRDESGDVSTLTSDDFAALLEPIEAN